VKLLKRALILFFSFLILALLLLFFYPRKLANVVGTSNTFATISANYQRKAFYANNYHWMFYCNGSHLLYSTSSDGSGWSVPSVVRKGISSSGISVWCDGGSVHYVYASGIPGDPVVYRHGFISGSTIDWEDEQTAVLGVEAHEYYNGYCILDSYGYPWAAYIEDYGSYRSSYVVRATSANGSSWSTPTRISEPSISIPRTSILPLSDGKVYAIYATTNEVNGRLWNGTEWGTQENIAETNVLQGYGYSVISHNDNVYLVLLEDGTYNLIYFKWASDTSWHGETILERNQSSVSLPVLSVDKLTGNLYCFWIYEGIIRMKTGVNDIWESSYSTPFGTTSSSPRGITCFYQAWDDKIGVAWLEQLNEVYRIRYRFLTLPY